MVSKALAQAIQERFISTAIDSGLSQAYVLYYTFPVGKIAKKQSEGVHVNSALKM